jgi:thiol-disulfide isomerase/thioredoxin
MKPALLLIVMLSFHPLTAQKATSISFKVNDVKQADTIYLSCAENYIDFRREEYLMPVNAKGKAEFTLMLGEPKEVTVALGEKEFLLYLEPGDLLTASINVAEPTTGALFTGSAAAAAVFYTDYQSKFGTAFEQSMNTTMDYMNLSPVKFAARQDSLLKAQLQFIEPRKEMVNDNAYRQLHSRITYTAMMNKLRYPALRFWFTRTPYNELLAELDAVHFFDFALNYKQPEEFPLLSEPVCLALWELNRWKYQQMRKDNPYSSMDELKCAAISFTGRFSAFMVSYTFYMQLAGGAFPEMDSAYQYVKRTVTDTGYIKIVQSHYDALRILKPGNPAPALNLKQFNGKPFSLDSLRGKTVLLEFWHSGCAPCLRGFAAANELHSRLPENVVMVYVCADADSIRGRKTLRQYQVQGIHVHAPGFKHPVLLDYHVQSFPLLYLIGADGKIISANAPRPGSKELDELLNPK